MGVGVLVAVSEGVGVLEGVRDIVGVMLGVGVTARMFPPPFGLRLFNEVPMFNRLANAALCFRCKSL